MSSLYDYVTQRITTPEAQWIAPEPVSSIWRVTEDDFLRRLGVAIKACRKYRKLSQEALGKMVGVPPNTISRWENGVSSLSAYNLALLYEALGVPAEWLLEPSDSISEVDRRLAELRRAAVEAARDDVAEELSRQGAGDTDARPGTD